MNFLEKDLETIIVESPQSELYKRGLYVLNYDLIIRQLNLGSYGILDLVTAKFRYREGSLREKEIVITIYELKHKIIDVNTLMQAAKYKRGLEIFIEDNYNINNTSLIFRLVLIGSSVQTKGDFVFLSDFIEDLRIFTYNYGFDGIHFQVQTQWGIPNPMFPKSLKGIIKGNVSESIYIKVNLSNNN